MTEDVIVFEAHSPLALPHVALRERVERCWHLTEQNVMYEVFTILLRPSLPLLCDVGPDELTPECCFQVRLLLIHFYRRIVLKDPLLPEKLLPAHWLDQVVRQLCINIHRYVTPGAQTFVSERGESPVRELPAPGSLYYQRFSGLAEVWQEKPCWFTRSTG